MLSPLDEALQMRPQTGRLDDSKKPIKDEDMAEEEEKKPTFVTVGCGTSQSRLLWYSMAIL